MVSGFPRRFGRVKQKSQADEISRYVTGSKLHSHDEPIFIGDGHQPIGYWVGFII